MRTGIMMVGVGHTIVEEGTVDVVQVNAERPVRSRAVNRSVEVVPFKEPTVLCATEYPVEVFVTDVEQIVIVVDGIVVPVQDIIDNLIDVPEEVVIDLVDIVELSD